jgi:hypothetical protein
LTALGLLSWSCFALAASSNSLTASTGAGQLVASSPATTTGPFCFTLVEVDDQPALLPPCRAPVVAAFPFDDAVGSFAVVDFFCCWDRRASSFLLLFGCSSFFSLAAAGAGSFCSLPSVPAVAGAAWASCSFRTLQTLTLGTAGLASAAAGWLSLGVISTAGFEDASGFRVGGESVRDAVADGGKARFSTAWSSAPRGAATGTAAGEAVAPKLGEGNRPEPSSSAQLCAGFSDGRTAVVDASFFVGAPLTAVAPLDADAAPLLPLSSVPLDSWPALRASPFLPPPSLACFFPRDDCVLAGAAFSFLVTFSQPSSSVVFALSDLCFAVEARGSDERAADGAEVSVLAFAEARQLSDVEALEGPFDLGLDVDCLRCAAPGGGVVVDDVEAEGCSTAAAGLSAATASGAPSGGLAASLAHVDMVAQRVWLGSELPRVR